MSIKVENITKIYGTQKALNNVSFEIPRGKIVGFLGPNGAGKSTMMKILTNYILPTSGQAWINGIEVTVNPIEVKKHIGYLPENNPLYLDLYIKEYLHFVAEIYKLGKNINGRINEIIEITGLSPEINKKIGALSKGYKQRVGLAQALIHNPNVLIFDEPTSGLDPNQIVEIRNLISNLGKEKTVLLSTHIMQEVEAICDRIIIINNGKIIADDTPDKIQKYNTGEIVTIYAEFDKNPGNGIKNIEGIKQIKEIKTTNFLFECNKDIRSLIFNYAVENKLTVLSMQIKEKSLEEVFRELTKS